MQIELTDAAIKILLESLESYSEVLGNAGCNDYELPATNTNAQFVRDAENWGLEKGMEPRVHNGKILTMDWLLVDYIRHLIKEQTR